MKLADFQQKIASAEKPIVVDFWATWCEACMVEMPSILKLRQEFKPKGFDLVAVNVDENPNAVLPKTLKKLGIDFPVFIDEENKLGDLFQIQAIPLTVIIDKDRKVLYIEGGEKDWYSKEVRELMQGWLGG